MTAARGLRPQLAQRSLQPLLFFVERDKLQLEQLTNTIDGL